MSDDKCEFLPGEMTRPAFDDCTDESQECAYLVRKETRGEDKRREERRRETGLRLQVPPSLYGRHTFLTWSLSTGQDEREDRRVPVDEGET